MSAEPVTGPSITVEESAQEAGLGPMLAELLRQNLEQHPHRRRDLERMRGGVAITAKDASVAVTMDFSGGGLTIREGIAGRPRLKIQADSLGLLELTSARLRAGLPDPVHHSGRRVLGRLAAGSLRIAGPAVLLRPMMLVRLTRLLNVAPE